MQPRRIASYTLLESVGHGGMSLVYRARQESLQRSVAIKVLSDTLAASPEFMERFRREARTAANLHHPNVITVYDFGEDERGVPYIVLEYIEGPTLADLMDAGLDDDRVADLLDQMAAGLDYAHAQGVVHRDVKPGTVLTTAEGRVVLTDFGIAWLLDGAQLTLAGGIVGTPEYMSPEQAAGLPFDGRADVYALGVVLYEMLVGERPFDAPTAIAILLQRLHEPAPSVLLARPELPRAVGDVVARALVREPDRRYASAGELAADFRVAFGQPWRSVAPAVFPPASVPGPVELVMCPECAMELPFGASICRGCGEMIPLDKLPPSYPSSYASPSSRTPASCKIVRAIESAQP